MEESFDPIAQTRANYYTPGSPVQFVQVELLKGSISGDRAVCLTFKNVSQVNLTALDILFKCKGTGSVILCEADFQYRDLDVKPGELFGMDDAVFVTDKVITSVDVILKKVYHGKQVVQLEKTKRVRLPAPRRLPAELEAALEQRMSRKGLKYAPQVLDNGWYCACGAFHPKEEDTVYCSECGCDRILLQNALNVLMQPEQPEPQPEPAPEATRVVGGAAPTAPVQEAQPDGTRAFDLTGRQKPAQAQPAEEPTRIMGYTAPAAPVEEPTRIMGYTAPSAPVEEVRPDGTRAFDLSGQQRGAAAQPVEEEAGSTRVLGGSRSVVEETSIDDTQAAPLHWRTHADEPFEPRSRRAAELVEEDEYDDEPEDAVAEAIIRWVPPLTALICAGIALSGFVYYQFFL